MYRLPLDANIICNYSFVTAAETYWKEALVKSASCGEGVHRLTDISDVAMDMWATV